jgi:hypothetical protein
MTGPRSNEPARISNPKMTIRVRTWLGLALVLPLLLAVAGCSCDDDGCGGPVPDHEAPAAPRDLYSITGDERVTLVWLANTELDVEGYYLWWSDSYTGPYHLITELPGCSDCYWMEYTYTGLENRRTFFYAVSAYDHVGNESDLSHEEVWDTPRPEGHASIGNADLPNGYDVAGFYLREADVVPADSPEADFYFTYNDLIGGYLVAGSDYYGGAETTEIQDMGWTDGFDEISFAPDDVGWSPTGTAEPIAGHTYVVLTREGHYAKIRLTGVGPDHVSFDWAFQLDAANRQLKAPEGS